VYLKAALNPQQRSPWSEECVARAKYWLYKTLMAQQKFDAASDAKKGAFEICGNLLPKDVEIEDSEEFFDQLASIWDGRLTGKLRSVPIDSGATQNRGSTYM
jgi:hypothetical protein